MSSNPWTGPGALRWRQAERLVGGLFTGLLIGLAITWLGFSAVALVSGPQLRERPSTLPARPGIQAPFPKHPGDFPPGTR